MFLCLIIQNCHLLSALPQYILKRNEFSFGYLNCRLGLFCPRMYAYYAHKLISFSACFVAITIILMIDFCLFQKESWNHHNSLYFWHFFDITLDSYNNQFCIVLICLSSYVNEKMQLNIESGQSLFPCFYKPIHASNSRARRLMLLNQIPFIHIIHTFCAR